MRTPRDLRLLGAAAIAAAFWLVFAVLRAMLSQVQSPVAQLAVLVPEVAPVRLLWSAGPLVVLTLLVSTIAVGLVHLLVTVIAGRRGSRILAAWFATVVGGTLVGFALDLAAAWSALGDYGLRGLLIGGFGAAAASGALWGIAVGWMPGLVARGPVGAASDVSSSKPAVWLPVSAAVAVVAVIAAGLAADTARTAAIEAEAAAQQEAEAAVTFGAMPDPDAPGAPVPERADTAVELDPQWCTADKAMVLKGEPDAATGHRAFPIRLMNFSDEPCVIEGYPDVAFGDQNEHLLVVTIERGSSFMTQDAGPQRIEVPAGGSAVAVLGWDAASTQGALVTKTVFAAPTAGMMRGSWPIDLDIVEGSSVAVTAWALDPGPGGTG